MIIDDFNTSRGERRLCAVTDKLIQQSPQGQSCNITAQPRSKWLEWELLTSALGHEVPKAKDKTKPNAIKGDCTKIRFPSQDNRELGQIGSHTFNKNRRVCSLRRNGRHGQIGEGWQMSAPADEKAILQSLEKLKSKVADGMKAVSGIKKMRDDLKEARRAGG